ncbi:MAG: hypothetical protein A2504_03760 [Bdellovibrionales bacterium RIFOXYD12_FULL_39_22]|nr:MAG: hypothetical protein A2385_11510 [Bdellovibrionales bacterium RIFOXYB1_FULL_39_21]OFZ41692.1 MAG: hypothetical protein A2485_01820 [Bdellovibrionales bacterium RIFOXYC12_FULL_39_17]OFZ46092.1 MAG: hypothetical protein A2404_12185 [Bdellovibrionales bacterium RIFOXYC1_FULL_39_130]OFZ74919.1 MAG: hypothetical protein A2560_15225 [Bdellovibrionales bacterium RIFOXYD1_FULL_39_84]OFZ75151.1 MAG: hypothetical protein A2451_15290 [Bdellovibrionales bacterium RIFOXYC2_FULL_39_8]OFZ92772.1 MAG:
MQTFVRPLNVIVAVIVVFVLSLLIPACGQNPPDKTKVTFNLQNLLGNRTRGGTIAQNGGVMIVGYSIEKAQTFSLALTNDTEESSAVLDNGSWIFAAMGWADGNIDNRMNGVARCSTEVPMMLTGANTIVSLTINTTNCKSSRFGGTEFIDSTTGSFKPLKVVACAANGVTETVTAWGECSALSEDYLSFKVMMPTMDLFYEGDMDQYVNEWPPFIHRDFTSQCYSFDAASKMAITDVRIPMGTSIDTLNFYPMILPFKTTDCDGGAIFDDRPYEIPRGHSTADWTDESENIFVRSDASSPYSVAFIMDRNYGEEQSCTLNDVTVTYDSINSQYIQGKLFSMCPSFDNALVTGDVFIFNTTADNYSKMYIESVGSSLKLKYTTYSKTTGAIVNTGTSGTSIYLNYGSQFVYDLDTPTFSGGSLDSINHDIYLRTSGSAVYFNSRNNVTLAKVKNEPIVACTTVLKDYDAITAAYLQCRLNSGIYTTSSGSDGIFYGVPGITTQANDLFLFKTVDDNLVKMKVESVAVKKTLEEKSVGSINLFSYKVFNQSLTTIKEGSGTLSDCFKFSTASYSSTCTVGINDWDIGPGAGNLRINSYIDFEHIPNHMTIIGTDISTNAMKVKVDGSYAYVADGSDGLKIFDISNKTAPTLVGGLSMSTPGVDLAITGNTAFLTRNNGSAFLDIIDITSKTSPSAYYAWFSLGAGSTSGGLAQIGSNLYIPSSTALYRVDVSTPTNPSVDGTFTSSDTIYDVTTSSDNAYVFTASGSYGMDSRTASLTSGTSLGYISNGTEDARSIVRIASSVYIGTSNYLTKIDVSTAASPTWNTQETSEGLSNPIADLATDGTYIFAASGSNMTVFRNDSAITKIGAVTCNPWGTIYGVAVSGDYAYMACGATGGLQIVDISSLP